MKKLFKNQIKQIKNLDSKKRRKGSGSFIVEGIKTVLELQNTGYEIEYLVFDRSFDPEKINLISKLLSDPEVYVTDEFERISSFKNSEGVIAVVKIPSKINTDEFLRNKKSLLGLFDINDPGNLGTIIRTSLWYGIEGIILFGNSVDIYSPKVVRGSMGSIFKSEIHCVEDFKSVSEKFDGFHIIGTFLDEKHNYRPEKSKKIMLLLGNEANGLDSKLKDNINCNYRINNINEFESLNVSVAAGIIMDRIFNDQF